jgi:hypothetical protein
MRTAVLSAGVALVLLSQPAASQGRGMTPANAVWAQAHGALGQVNATLASVGINPGVIAGGARVSMPLAGAAPLGAAALGGGAAPSPRGVVPAVPLASVGINHGAISISTGVARPVGVAVPSGYTAVGRTAMPSLQAMAGPLTPPTASVRATSGKPAKRVAPSATALGSAAGNTISAGSITSTTGSSAAGASVGTSAAGSSTAGLSSAPGSGSVSGRPVSAGFGTSTAGTSEAGPSLANTSVLPLPARLRPVRTAVGATANPNQIATVTLNQVADIQALGSTSLTNSERAELERLRRENQQLRSRPTRAR